jgi:hypothetical protein
MRIINFPYHEPLPPPEKPPPPLWTPTTVTAAGVATMAGGATTMAVYQAPSAFARWAPTIILVLTILAVIGIVAWNIFIKVKESKKDQ